MTPALLWTPLYEWHVAHGARMVDFAGWAMPLQYRSITEEHLATRRSCGIVDISHMGRLRFEGPGAEEFLAALLTRRIGEIKLGQIRYSLVTNEQGGILDDVLTGYYHNEMGQPFYLVVVNASNREKIVQWTHRHLPPERAGVRGKEVLWTDVTRLWAMFAIQGPNAVEVLQPLVDVDLDTMKYYNGALVRILHPAARRQGGIISRTGYTGEDGFELSVGAGIATGVWEAILEQGKPFGIVPTGLGARDTLRLEAGMPLYGHELGEDVDPFQAGLGYACYLTGVDFPGREALVRLQNEPVRWKRVGLELSGRRIARERSPVLAGDERVGWVTSGTFSPSLQRSIAMAYVRPDRAEPGTELSVDIRGRREPACVVKLPFYRRRSKGTTP
ncbi:MAG: glycine cleavage system aminomethyltransferase GcvT [Thermoguttaceae bacterium]|jgi:aminomethyltransferase|nr:glycine cleavage system aminomethyltransferase GcvT [Thermoguttaceae bacterium]